MSWASINIWMSFNAWRLLGFGALNWHKLSAITACAGFRSTMPVCEEPSEEPSLPNSIQNCQVHRVCLLRSQTL